jgi:predicted lactoylglutathione lyase
MTKQIFINLPVKDLSKTIDFFTKLGFTFNPQFTDENATCMIIGENIFAMLLVERFFKGFIPGKDISDTSKSTEVLMGITAATREEVDEMIDEAVATGGKEFREAQDYGWMYGRAFQDLDGHIWELFFMDESQMPEEMKKRK